VGIPKYNTGGRLEENKKRKGEKKSESPSRSVLQDFSSYQGRGVYYRLLAGEEAQKVIEGAGGVRVVK